MRLHNNMMYSGSSQFSALMPPKNPSHFDYIFFIYATLTFHFFVQSFAIHSSNQLINISSTIENTTNHCFKSLLNLANIKKNHLMRT
jgi:hypothetical protein